jgi:hypothetical protein
MKSQRWVFMRHLAGIFGLALSFGITLDSDAQTKAAGNPPVIEQQPIGRVVSEGGHVTFSVTATGTSPLSYEWRKNGLPLPTSPHIAGNATAVLNIDPVGTNDPGGYAVVITNGAGSITSSLAVVTLNQLFVQLSVVPGSGLNARVFSLLGDVCRIESANDVAGPWAANAFVTNFFGSPPQAFLPFAGLGNFLRARFDHMLPILYPTGVGTSRAYGKLNQVWRFDGSDDLRTWFPLETITNSTGWVSFGDPTDAIPLHRFYRIAPP